MRSLSYAVLVLALAAAAVPSRAQTLAERQETQREDAKLAEALGVTNAHFGTSLTASIEWSDFLPHKDKLSFATGDCEAALTAITQLCNDPLGKQAILQKIHALSCVYAGSAKQSLSLDPAGTLKLSIDLDGANYNPFTQKWLGDHL